jgi:hypothetical protein
VKQTPRYFDVATEITADHENDDEDDSRGAIEPWVSSGRWSSDGRILVVKVFNLK